MWLPSRSRASSVDQDAQNDLPLRSELLSVMQMAAHGKALAASHQLSSHGGPDRLLVRLAQNAERIATTCSELTGAVTAARQITPAAEWLLDNYYLIEQQIRIARRHLPHNYSKQLPRLGNGPGHCPGRPRVYQIALEIISHGDGRVDPESLNCFVHGYQEVATLTLGELWAIPIMLRLALIENLRRAAVLVADNHRQRDLASAWSTRMIEVAAKNPSSLILLVADMARSNPSLSSVFVAELARRLQGRGPVLTLALSWVTHRLAEFGLTIEQQIQAEIQQQAIEQVSISNSIGSLRFLGTMDWQEFVEAMSSVERTLRLDPAQVYDKMDFPTRDQYRHAIERIARHCPHSEAEVAAHALQLARDHGHTPDSNAGHVGFYLIGRGVPALEKRVGMRPPLASLLYKSARAAPLATYLGSTLLLTALMSQFLFGRAIQDGVHGVLLASLSVLILLCSSALALALVNWLATLVASVHSLPRMDIRQGIPAAARTLVAVPALIYSKHNVDCLCEQIEVRYLANRDPNLLFCLLTDWTDADVELLPQDAALLQQSADHVRRLNKKYAPDSSSPSSGPACCPSPGPFLLLHRPRQWNACQQAWMGHERKRGKLSDLNQFLRGGARDRFSLVVGDPVVLAGIKYVITLDADTHLPRDAARHCIAAMQHPLNRPRLDAARRRVVDGHGILQPRVAVSLLSSQASLYERLCSGEPGIDPYTRTVSDVYQDVFHEGSFIGKGIYDVDVFEQVLGERLPQNLILSHDLLEGCYLRSGLLNDTQLYEQAPGRYNDDVSRRQRWIRGDWQLCAWLGPRVPGLDGKMQANVLTALSRWKLFDNLRRSLMAPAYVGSLLLAWCALPQPGFWTGAVLLALFGPALAATMVDLCRKPPEALVRQHLAALSHRARQQGAHAVLHLAFLPHEAWFSLDAILRTLWRMTVSHRHLLEWRASALCGGGASLACNVRAMWMAPALALLTATTLLVARPQALSAAVAILCLWFLSPAIAWWVSRPTLPAPVVLSAGQTRFLHVLARKTWAFFETYVGADDNWLPPDNMQEHPVLVVAHRTSPTNIGLALLANLTAHDFGYITGGQLIERTGNTLAAMAKLERHADSGHFYNWYDTRSLQPLYPAYISTVDSGNLAGHLLTLQPGLLALPELAIIGPQIMAGLAVTCAVLQECADAVFSGVAQGGTASEKAQSDALQGALQRLHDACAPGPLADLPQLYASLTRIDVAANAVCALVPVDCASLQLWSAALARQSGTALAELCALAPWAAQPPDALFDASLMRIPTLRQLADLPVGLPSDLAPAERARQQALATLVAQGRQAAIERIAEIARLVALAHAFTQMAYGFLYNRTTKLLSIGYNLSEHRLDASCYDLLASEARLCSFIAIAQGQLPQEHWFALGRQLCFVDGQSALLSWSGSLFEYLMPLLVMPNYPNTLLDQTYGAAVDAQIAYGKRRSVPWGISESGYNTVDANLNYQYRGFGVPGLGLKRGLADDLVVAPYASMLALMVRPASACDNLQRMQAAGFMGHYGFYEAIDYTPVRLPRGQSHVLIRSFMAHHQGMGLLALNYLLNQQPMQRRFACDPMLQSTLLVLQERVPQAGIFHLDTSASAALRIGAPQTTMPMRILKQADSATPETQLLSNGRYHVMVTNAGGSYSRWKDLDVTRWRADGTCDNWGNFCYVRDLDDASVWSTTHQPTLVLSRKYEVIFSEGRAEFRRSDADIDLHTEIVVSPEDDIELRRTRISNGSQRRRRIELTSFAEVVMAPAAADAAHPAFGKLFVQTEILHSENAVLCTRRPRSEGEHPPWMLHLMVLHDGVADAVSFETDRAQFIGRGNTAQSPCALQEPGPLAGHEGAVLDPVVAIRYCITLEPNQVAIIDIITGMAETRKLALHLIDKYQDRHLAERVLELAWSHSQMVLRQLNASETDAQLYGRLANTIIYPHAALRAEAAILIKNLRGQSGLWAYAISGDLPIVLLQIRDPVNIELARQMVQAHAYWRLKGLAVDLVIWYEDLSGYRQLLHEQIMGLIASGADAQAIDRPGGIFVRLADQIANEDRILLQSVARAIISDSRGTLAEQVKWTDAALPRMPALLPDLRYLSLSAAPGQEHAAPRRPLVLENGLGGFTPDGTEYVITTSAAQRTPAPWSNVLANHLQFGSVISESGQAYTWSENAHEFRLTPWHNDPISDSSGEAFYLRDEDSGQFWSPTALPARGSGDYVARHGFGYSVFEHREFGIASELLIYVAQDAAIKYSVLTVRNTSGLARRLSATGYVEWVLGDMRSKSGMHIITEVDPVSGALFARNAYNTEFPGRVAFFNVDASQRSITTDRTEFIGRNGTLASPAALRRVRLSGKVGAALDACCAIMVPFDLLPGQQREIIFMLGVSGRRSADASNLVQRCQGAAAARSALLAVRAHWQQTLGAVQIETPDPALDIIANGWLMYQTIACRLWARSGYYQCGGAYGFRDQLQDAMALVHTAPQLLRQQLLLCAAHQFIEGDVMHWWHPPSERGVRTHCSDDYLWLPLATCRYVSSSGDRAVLAETIHFLEGRAVNPDEDSYYDLPSRSCDSADLYQHCVRAIRRALRFGVHGLPLIGSCDWNDGMDKVGAEGRGESVWLAFFLSDVLLRFADLAHQNDDAAFATECRSEAARLAVNVELHGWDGAWYRRAYFDDGTPLGSQGNQECQIDSISQSWAVLSGVADATRARSAMAAVDARLVRRASGLIQLLAPPFGPIDAQPDPAGTETKNPGYIRGYVPGVRENGGQYTHAAVWSAMAFAKLGDGTKAWELLRMLNPVSHAATEAGCARYKVEPYVVAADVYAVAPHIGRGGWTWYTGSSGWMYRLIIESLLGLTLNGARLTLTPLLPQGWDGCTVRYRHGASLYRIHLISVADAAQAGMSVDGHEQGGNVLALQDDGREHAVALRFAAPMPDLASDVRS
jgi:cellobiose phosphorylase